MKCVWMDDCMDAWMIGLLVFDLRVRLRLRLRLTNEEENFEEINK